MLIEDYQVDMTFCCVEICVRNGIIIGIPPILRCWKGCKWEKFYDYYHRQKKINKVTKLKTEHHRRRRRRY